MSVLEHSPIFTLFRHTFRYKNENLRTIVSQKHQLSSDSSVSGIVSVSDFEVSVSYVSDFKVSQSIGIARYRNTLNIGIVSVSGFEYRAQC